MRTIDEKIMTYLGAEAKALEMRNFNVRLVITNGCFDLLHSGHVRYLEQCRKEGDFLMVGVNADWAVRKLKGDGRPLNPINARMAALAGLEAVDMVCPIDAMRVTGFIEDMRAHAWVKGGDYTLETLDQAEVAAARLAGTKIVIKPMVVGVSTTSIIARARM